MSLKKLVVTNRRALARKYGPAGMADIDAALAALVASDEARGISTRIASVDDAAVLGSHAVTSAAWKPCKTAVDHLLGVHGPQDYVMLLGSVDVIPHQKLRNPVFDGEHDADRWASSDLPYACDAPASQRIADFRAPSRVVSRLPDITGASEPGFLVRAIRCAAAATPRPAEDFAAKLGLSASVWRTSTNASLKALGGGAAHVSPPSGPPWSQDAIAPRVHFINCHGAPSDENFYGQAGTEYPVAWRGSDVAGRITPGTLAAVECCYGAELYEPPSGSSEMPVCCRYLDNGAFAYFGSTTIAYGPADSNGQADLIARYFLEAALRGTTVGSAALFARQEFVRTSAPLDPVELKTLAQFVVYGDPSIRAVATAPAPKAMAVASVSQHRERRKGYAKTARALGAGVDVCAVRGRTSPLSGDVSARVRKLCADLGLVPSRMRTWAVATAPGATARKAMFAATGASPVAACHVTLAAAPVGSSAPVAAAHSPGVVRHVAIVIREHADGLETRVLPARGGIPRGRRPDGGGA